jgi:signal transduction histidine kinase
MRGKSLISYEGFIQFTKVFEELKSSILDLMEIADNMIPEELLKIGLKEYLQKICDVLETDKVKINIYITNEFDGLTENTVINIYRIFINLIKYLLNHSQSTEINLIFSKQNNILRLQEIDNGENFNLHFMAYPSLFELAEIKAIVDKMHGNFNISRRDDNKNELNIELLS